MDPRKPVQCFGKEASNYAKQLLSNKTVSLESDPTQGDWDKYHRLLRYVWLDTKANANEIMIADGYAYEYTYNTPYKYQSEFKAAQHAAEDAGRGLWSSNACSGKK
ncbi:MAG: thermonuclease family protein [Candidatus Levyibacteriota bacterium]